MRFLLSAALLLGLGSCSLLEEEPEPVWESATIENGPPRRDLFQLIQFALVQAEFPPGQNDPVAGRASSGWDLHLAPYSGKGYRERVLVEATPGEEAGSWNLRVRVERQRNVEKHLTLEEDEADWEPDADNSLRARIVLQQILTQIH